MKIGSFTFPIQKLSDNTPVNRSENGKIQRGSDCLVSTDFPKLSQGYYNAVNNIVSFKGTRMDSSVPKIIGNVSNVVVHETYFFRDLEELEFVRDYVKENLPKGTHIADFACSIGEESYSLAMVLDDINKDRKYKITGYDISPEAIDIAKKGEFIPMYRVDEGFLLDSYIENPRLKKYKSIFYNSFEPVKIKPEENCFCTGGVRRSDFLTPKKEVFNDIVRFKVADICEAGNENVPKKTGVVLFRNVWYHFTDYYPDNPNPVQKKSMDTLDMITKKVNKILPENGLFVVGKLQKDHMITGLEPTNKVEFNDRNIDVVDNSPFHNILKQNGFVPVYYELCPDWSCPTTIYIPTIWKKVKDACK